MRYLGKNRTGASGAPCCQSEYTWGIGHCSTGSRLSLMGPGTRNQRALIPHGYSNLGEYLKFSGYRHQNSMGVMFTVCAKSLLPHECFAHTL